MKRIIALFLVGFLVISMYTSASAIQQEKSLTYSEAGKQMLDYLQTDNHKLLISRKNYCYMTFVQDFNSNTFSLYLLEMVDKLIDTGKKPDKEKYIEVLTNIIAIYDLDNAEYISEQKKNSNLKNLRDYGMDVAEMGRNAVTVMAGSNSSISEMENAISIAVDGLGTLTDNVDNWIEALSNLETVIQNYSEHEEFLQVIENNSTGELKEAANILRKGMREAIKIKLDTYKNVSEENFKNYKNFFFSNVFLDTIKQMPEYKTDAALRYLVDIGDGIQTKVATLEGAWNLGTAIGTLVGDVAVGGENLLDRVLEMMAIYDISVILQEKVIDINTEFLKNIGESNEEGLVNDYVVLSQYLIGCRIRGEYCIYSIVAEDAGLLSWFNKKSRDEAKAWYEDKVGKIGAIKENLEKIFYQFSEKVKQSEDNVILEGAFYEYSNGEYLSDFSIDVLEGKKNAELMFWHNYGDSSSDEDFFFEWKDGKWKYEIEGNRSKKKFLLRFTPHDNRMLIQVTCLDGVYYSWENGKKNDEWSNAEYNKLR